MIWKNVKQKKGVGLIREKKKERKKEKFKGKIRRNAKE